MEIRNLLFFLLSFCLVFVSISSLASNKDATVTLLDRQYALLRIESENAKDIQAVIKNANNANIEQNTDGKQSPSETQKLRISCNNSVCGFVISSKGELLAIPNIDQINDEMISNWDKLYPTKKGEVALSRTISSMNYRIMINGKAAASLFNFLVEQQSSTNNSPYSVSVSALTCTKEPVSETYECYFKINESGFLNS